MDQILHNGGYFIIASESLMTGLADSGFNHFLLLLLKNVYLVSVAEFQCGNIITDIALRNS